MFDDLPLWPEQASTIASRVDAVTLFVLGVTVFFTLAISVCLLAFAIRYRRRSEDEYPRPVIGSTPLETAWIVIPLGINLVIFFWATRVYYDAVEPPDDALTVYVVGRQWMWKLQHPDGQREINELHVPVGRPVKLLLASEDVIHSFFVPAFRIKQDAVPGRYTLTWFQATRPGRYHVFCAEYCGTSHSRMVGTVVALEPAEYEAWLDGTAEGAPALEGRKLFAKLQCVTCHTGRADARAPNLEELYGRPVALQMGGQVVADEAYLRESILTPDAKVVAGFRPIMPAYQGQVSEEEIFQLLAFLRTLGPGQTPPRVEEAEPPGGQR